MLLHVGLVMDRTGAVGRAHRESGIVRKIVRSFLFDELLGAPHEKSLEQRYS